MAQLVVRKLDDDAKKRLEGARQASNGRSLEAEARAILEEAANGERTCLSCATDEKGFGNLMHERVQGIGFTDEEYAEFNSGILPK